VSNRRLRAMAYPSDRCPRRSVQGRSGRRIPAHAGSNARAQGLPPDRVAACQARRARGSAYRARQTKGTADQGDRPPTRSESVAGFDRNRRLTSSESAAGSAASGSALWCPLTRASPQPVGSEASEYWFFCRFPLISCRSYLPLPIVRAFSPRSRFGLSVSPPFGLGVPQLASPTSWPIMPSADSCARSGRLSASSVPNRNVTQASLGKFDRLPRTPAGSTALALDGCGLRD
jgi:hypothetical protein